MSRTIRAPRGTTLTCKNWLIEAAYRMIQNNLDPEVAFDPEHLIVYGGRGTGRAQLGVLRRDPGVAAQPGAGRDAARPIRASRWSSSRPTRTRHAC